MMINKKAVYAGTFDPITNGHIDIIKQAKSIFDTILLAISCNNKKNTIFTLKERVLLAKKSVSNLNNIQVIGFDILLVDFLKIQKCNILIRGLRTISDFESEMHMAHINKKFFPKLKIIFFISSIENMFISSSIIKEIASYNGNIKPFIPYIVYNALLKKNIIKKNII